MKSDKSGEEMSIVVLTPQQTQAIDWLLAGQSVTSTADTVSVAYETVSRWRNHDPVFVAAFNARRVYLWESNLERLRSLSTQAIDVIEKTLNSRRESTRLKAAGMILRGVQLDRVEPPSGLVDPTEIEKEWERAVAWQRLQDVMRGF